MTAPLSRLAKLKHRALRREGIRGSDKRSRAAAPQNSACCRGSSARRGDEIDPPLDRHEISSLAVSATRFSILAKSAVENGAWSKAYEPICLVHLRDPACC
jgi:hypothetical protein